MGLFSSSKSSSKTTITTTDQRIAADEGSIVAGPDSDLTINTTDFGAIEKALTFSEDAFNKSLDFARESALEESSALTEKVIKFGVPVAIVGIVAVAYVARSR